jgi:hypothetical protein
LNGKGGETPPFLHKKTLPPAKFKTKPHGPIAC